MLEVIFELLADPVLPTSTVAFSSTCKGLLNAMPLQVLELLVERHGRVKDLCRRLRPSNRYDLAFPSPWRPPLTPDQLRNFCPCFCPTMASCKKLHEAPELEFLCQHVTNEETTTADMETMAMILRTNGLPRLQSFDFHYQASYTRWDRQTGCVGVDIRPFCQGLVRTSFVSLRSLALQYNRFGPSGAEALAAALGRGATPALGSLSIGMNEIGNQGVAALAAPLRKLRLLQDLGLSENGIGDDGVASLHGGRPWKRRFQGVEGAFALRKRADRRELHISSCGQQGRPAAQHRVFRARAPWKRRQPCKRGGH